MKLTIPRPSRDERGAQAVEFALIVPVVLILFAAIIQFGFLFNAQVTVTQAAREGARIASLNPQTSSCDLNCVYGKVVPKVINGAPGVTLDSTATSANTQISITPCTSTSNQNQDAVVIISYDVTFGEPLTKVATIHVHGKAHMPCGG